MNRIIHLFEASNAQHGLLRVHHFTEFGRVLESYNKDKLLLSATIFQVFDESMDQIQHISRAALMSMTFYHETKP